MRRNRIIFVGIVVVALAIVAVSLLTNQGVNQVTGPVGSEKAPFFEDERVQKALRRHGLEVTVQKAGSREIATSFDLGQYDFAFPSGAPAAEKIQRETGQSKSSTPFFTPMAIASWKPIADLFVQQGMAQDQGGYYTIDMGALPPLFESEVRWKDIPNNTAFAANKSLLITTTDVRKSNSAAMYLALMSYVANGNNIVQSIAEAQPLMPLLTNMFLRQGLRPSSSLEPFEDYLVKGMGHSPAVMVYEAQFIAQAALEDGSIQPEMVLMYPVPTIFTKHILIPLTAGGEKLGEALATDPELQKLAIEYGFRNDNLAYFQEFTKAHGVTMPDTFVDVIEPPSYEEDIDANALQGFFKGQVLTAGSSGWLAESYVREQDELDGMINYESVLLALNESKQLNEPLVLIYPREGIVMADYPLMLLDSSQREPYDRLIEYIRSPEFQEKLMQSTLRRPVVPGIRVDSRIPDPLLVELPFPNTVEVIDSLLFSYLDEQRLPSHTFFVLDVSGSMEGKGLQDLKTALTNLTGLDQSLTGQFARFRSRERITMLPFSSVVEDVSDFAINSTAAEGEDMERIRRYAEQLQAGGNTAIYLALADAYSQAQQAQAQDPDRYYSIVLMSDGRSNTGISQREFRSYYQDLPPELQQVKTFTALFGDVDREEMARIAELTGGRMFDAQSESLSQIFKEIRGYQ